MPQSRTRKILSLGLVTASLGVGGMTLASPGRATTAAKTAPQRAKAAPATPLLASNGRPACGNTLRKTDEAGERAMLTADLAALTKLFKTNTDDDKPAERDALIASIRVGLDNLQACGEPTTQPAAEAVPFVDAWPGDYVTAQ